MNSSIQKGFGIALLCMSVVACQTNVISEPGWESNCGNGIVDPNEFCDDGDLNSDSWSVASHCNATCTGIGPYCGDGNTDAPEVCDLGGVLDGNSEWISFNTGSYGGCQSDCLSIGGYCGDNEAQTDFEVCDGNTEACENLAPYYTGGIATCFPNCQGYKTNECDSLLVAAAQISSPQACEELLQASERNTVTLHYTFDPPDNIAQLQLDIKPADGCSLDTALASLSSYPQSKAVAASDTHNFTGLTANSWYWLRIDSEPETGFVANAVEHWFKTAEDCDDLDGDGLLGLTTLCSSGTDYCDGDSDNWTQFGCDNCIDADGDHKGENCDKGPDCDDLDDRFYEDCPISLQMIEITPGSGGFSSTFTMGSPVSQLGRSSNETTHTVTLTHDIFMMAYEVNQRDFETLMGINPNTTICDQPTCPVNSVTWYDALAYANQLSIRNVHPQCFEFSGVQCQDGSIVGTDYMLCYEESNIDYGIYSATVTLASGLSSIYDCTGYRLPTEAEWEYTARAGTTTAHYNGNLSQTDCTTVDNNLSAIAWYCNNSGGQPRPQEGGFDKTANSWGFYNVIGNIAEWVWDEYEAYSGNVTDPTGGSISGTTKVMRGGSYNPFDVFGKPPACRSAWRGAVSSTGRLSSYGFRLVGPEE